jgi:hypothetical protein
VGPALLLRAIADPGSLARLTLPEWEALLACARRNVLAAHVSLLAQRAGVESNLPPEVRRHLEGARLYAARIAQLGRWELDRIRRAVGPGVSLIALKGAGYLLRGLDFAGTRLMSDVDILVPREALDAVERALLDAGWQGAKLDPYDQTYYRRWMHELPPLQFPGRTLGVDLHHTISPPVSRLRPDAALFWEDSQATAFRGYRVLSPADTFLHSAVHLFFDSDFRDRFRDLVDLHELAAHFGASPDFWEHLSERAQRQGLGRPLFHAVDHLRRILGTPMPAPFVRAVTAAAPRQPVRGLMRALLGRVLPPADPATWPPPNAFTAWLLYARSHWLRMPPHLLIPHLARKAVRGPARTEIG